MALPHRIRRLRWNVTSNARDEAFAARASLRQMLDTGLLDEIGRAFDAVSSGDEVVHLPRLELVVRIGAIDRVGAEVIDGIRRELEEQLALSRGARDVPRRDAIRRDRFTASGASERVIAYLASGVLPWPLATGERQSTLEYLRQAAAVHLDRILARVPEHLPDAMRFVFRWLQLLPPEEWSAVGRRVEQSVPVGHVSGLADAIAALTAASAPVASEHRRIESATELIVSVLRLSAPVGRPSIDPVARALSRLRQGSGAAGERGEGPVGRTLSRLRQGSGAAGEPGEDPVGRALLGPPAEPVARALSGPRAEADPSTSSGSPRAESRGDKPRPTTTETPRATPDAEPDAFGLTVEHAGLILIHPFLPQLFEHTGLWARGVSRLADESLPRAAALLSYLALGDDYPIEFDLPLIKVLLGLQPETALPLAAGLIDGCDMQEADDLLASVVEHWRALKQTSIAALRASFLQRRGLLAAADDGWRLRVEGRPFDLLLDQLPWGFGTVKLRWMTAPIFTEWMTP